MRIAGQAVLVAQEFDMQKDRLISKHNEMTSRCRKIMEKKNADYTGGSVSPYANFERSEIVGLCNTETAILVRMLDKFSRIVSFVSNGKLLVEDESVQDTLDDLLNYCVILAGYIDEKKSKSES